MQPHVVLVSVQILVVAWPFYIPDASVASLHERMLPNAEKVSCNALWSIPLSKFLINIFSVPLLRILGSRWEYIILSGFPLRGVKFNTSNALAASWGLLSCPIWVVSMDKQSILCISQVS